MKFCILLFALLFALGFIVSNLSLGLKNNIYYHDVYPQNPYPTNGPTNSPTNAPTLTNGLTNTPSNVPTSPTPNDLTNVPTDGPVITGSAIIITALTNPQSPNPSTPLPPRTDGPVTPPAVSPVTPPSDNGWSNSSTQPTSVIPSAGSPVTSPSEGGTNPSILPTDGQTNSPTSPPNNVCDQSGGNRMIGGTDAPVGAYPYQISMRYALTNNHFCGGSIISDRWILTAAHCVIDSFPLGTGKIMYIVAGANLLNISILISGTPYGVQQIVMHPAYDNVTMVNDYALVKVINAIAFGPTVAPIQLATQRPPVGSSALATGWGYTNATLDKFSNSLQQLCVRVISNEECANTWFNIPNTVGCTFNGEGEGICQGDAGGPLVWNNRQFGIVSFGPQICASGLPDVYASVPDAFQWIKSITGISG